MSTAATTEIPPGPAAVRPLAKAFLGFTVSTLSLCVLTVALAAL